MCRREGIQTTFLLRGLSAMRTRISLLLCALLAVSGCKSKSGAKVKDDGDAERVAADQGAASADCTVAGQSLDAAACAGYETIRGKRTRGANGWDWDVTNAQLANPQAFDWKGLTKIYNQKNGASVVNDYTRVSEADKAKVWTWFNERYGFIGNSDYDASNTPFGITVNTQQNLGRFQKPSAQNPWFHMNCLTCHLGEAKDSSGTNTAWMGLPNYKIKWPLLWQELNQFNDLPNLANPTELLNRMRAKFDKAVRDIIGTPPATLKEKALYVTKIPGILKRLKEHVSQARAFRISDLIAKGEELQDFFAKYVFSLYFADKNWFPGQSPAAFIGFFGLKSKDLTPGGSFNANYPGMIRDFFPNTGSLIKWGEKDFSVLGKKLFSIPYIAGIDPSALKPVLAYKEYVIPDNVLPWAWSRITAGHFTEQIFIKRRGPPDVRPLLNGSFFFTEPDGNALMNQTFQDRMVRIQTLVDSVQLPPAVVSSEADFAAGAAGESVFKANCGRCHNALTLDPGTVQTGVGSAPHKNFKDVGTDPALSIMYQVSAGITGNIPYFTKAGFTNVVRQVDPKDKGRYRAQVLVAPWVRQRIFHDASVTFADLMSGAYNGGAGHDFVAGLSADDRAKVAAYLNVRCVVTAPTTTEDGSFGVLTGPSYANDCKAPEAAVAKSDAPSPAPEVIGEPGAEGEAEGAAPEQIGSLEPPEPAAQGDEPAGPQADDTAGGRGPDVLGDEPAPDPEGTVEFDQWFQDLCSEEGLGGCENIDDQPTADEISGTAPVVGDPGTETVPLEGAPEPAGPGEPAAEPTESAEPAE